MYILVMMVSCRLATAWIREEIGSVVSGGFRGKFGVRMGAGWAGGTGFGVVMSVLACFCVVRLYIIYGLYDGAANLLSKLPVRNKKQ